MKHFPSSGRVVSPVANTYRDTYSNFDTEMEDSGWSKTVEVTKILLSVIRVLVDNTIVDYDTVSYAQIIQDHLEALKDEFGSRLSSSDDFELTLRGAKNLVKASQQYESYGANMDRAKESNIRFINTVAFDFEKSFISDYDVRTNAIPSHVNTLKRHVLYSKLDDTRPFPQLRSLLEDPNSSQAELESEIRIIYWHLFQANQALLSTLWSTLQRQI